MNRAIRRSMARAKRKETTGGAIGDVPTIPPDLRGWMTEEEFERNLDRLPRTEVHWTCCEATGRLFAKLCTHSYRDVPWEELLRLREERRPLVLAAGGTPYKVQAPLPLEVEMLDHILEFHLFPPCGCPSVLGGNQVGKV